MHCIAHTHIQRRRHVLTERSVRHGPNRQEQANMHVPGRARQILQIHLKTRDSNIAVSYIKMLPPVYFISVHRSKVHSDTVCRACRIQFIGNSNACTIRNANHGDHVARPPTFPLRPCPCLCPSPLPAVKRSKVCKSFRAQAMERLRLLSDAK